MGNPIAVLEVGTSEVRVVVAEPREDGLLMITGVGRYPSSGVRKSELVDFENAKICVKKALLEAEENAQVAIQEIFMVFSGDHIKQIINRGSVNVLSMDQVITADEREEVVETARAVSLPHDHEILHSITRKYYIGDETRGVLNPDGMEASRLSLEMLILYCQSNRLRNLYRLAEEAALEVTEVAFAGLCCGLSVLTPQQKEVGAILIDLGAGTSDYVVYSDNEISLAGSLGVGGDHVTNDLAMGLNLSTTQSERLKVKYGAAMVDLSSRGRRIPIPPETGFRAQEVLSRDVNTIIHARMEEVFELIKAQVDKEVKKKNFGAGVILTGGGAKMTRVQDLATRVFQLPCHIGYPREISGLALPSESPEFASTVGMLKYGVRYGNMADRGPRLGNLLRKMFGKP
ncbi:cell division protein FtsA [Kiritimatiellaeota bacterium B1221]|nr:cell division protein FtsA [Kiritimatiellaeota bacterium B1221]